MENKFNWNVKTREVGFIIADVKDPFYVNQHLSQCKISIHLSKWVSMKQF